MNIADLWISIKANLKGFDTTVQRQATKTGEKAGKNVAKGIGKTASLKTGILQGLGLGAGIGLIGAAARSIGLLTDAVGDATKAAIEDEQSQVKLKAALRANVVGWDGNTAAIEKTIGARMKLGFSDDEQRDNLARLTAATHDTTKALDLQRTAMDLARFTGVDLATAGEQLIKVQAGQFRVLKTLGIQVKKGITSQEALAEIQKVVAGQAESYANTVGGKLLANQVRFDEAMENFGYKTLPLVSGAFETLTYAMDRTAVPLKTLLKMVEHGAGPASAQLQQLRDISEEFGISLEDAWQKAADAGTFSIKELRQADTEMRDDLDHTERMANRATGSIGDGFIDMGDDAATGTKRVRKSVKDMKDELNEAAQDLLDNFFGPIHAEEDRHDARLAVYAARELLAKSKTAKAAAAAKREIVSALEGEGAALATLGAQGELSKKDVDKFAADAKAAYADMGKKVPKALDKIIAKLREVASFDANIRIDVATRKLDNKTGNGPRAGGGYVGAGELYRVNERGSGRDKEFFRPSMSGEVIPIAAGAQASSSAGYTDNSQTHLNVGRLDKRTMADVRREMKMISDVKRLRKAG